MSLDPVVLCFQTRLILRKSLFVISKKCSISADGHILDLKLGLTAVRYGPYSARAYRTRAHQHVYHTCSTRVLSAPTADGLTVRAGPHCLQSLTTVQSVLYCRPLINLYNKYRERSPAGGDPREATLHRRSTTQLTLTTRTADPRVVTTTRVVDARDTAASCDPPPPVSTGSSTGTAPGRRGVDRLAYARVPSDTALPPATGPCQVALAG